MKIQTKHIRILYAAAAVLIMLAAFMFSAQSGDSSGETSMSVTENVSQHFSSGNISRDTLEILEQIIRKLAHFIEFAALGFFTFAFTDTFTIKRKKAAIISLVFSSLYALSDEIHQYFVPERACRLTDVLLDTFGALCGILIFIALCELIKKLKAKYIK